MAKADVWVGSAEGYTFRVTPRVAEKGERLFSISDETRGVALNLRYLIEELVTGVPSRLIVALGTLPSLPGCPIPRIGSVIPLGQRPLGGEYTVKVETIEYSLGEGGPGHYIAAVRYAAPEAGGAWTLPQRGDVTVKPDPQSLPWQEWDFSGDFSVVQDNGGVRGMWTGAPVALTDIPENGALMSGMELKLPELTSGEPILNIPGRELVEAQFTFTVSYMLNREDIPFGGAGMPLSDKPPFDWNAHASLWSGVVGSVNAADFNEKGIFFPKNTLKCVGVGIHMFKYSYTVPWPNGTRDPFGRPPSEVFQTYTDPPSGTPVQVVAFNNYGIASAKKSVKCVKATMILRHRAAGFMHYVPNKSTNEKVYFAGHGGEAKILEIRPENGQRVPNRWLNIHGSAIKDPEKADMLFIPVSATGHDDDKIHALFTIVVDGLDNG